VARNKKMTRNKENGWGEQSCKTPCIQFVLRSLIAATILSCDRKPAYRHAGETVPTIFIKKILGRG